MTSPALSSSGVDLLSDCRVILVRPMIPANIGATARAMRNMGFSRLILVAPAADHLDREARRLSTHGESILRNASLAGDLRTALADCVLVAATSACIGGPVRRQSVGSPSDVLSRFVEAGGGPTALVFGPEQSGLTDAEVTLCHYLIHIPSDPGYTALNLSHAVAICLYELRRHATSSPRPSPRYSPAPFESLDRMFAQLRDSLDHIGFLHAPGSPALMHALRHLIARAQPSQMEVDMLFGLARQLHYIARHRAPGPPTP